jgi:NAD+ kinase
MKLAIIANPQKYSVREPFINALGWADTHDVQVVFCEELQELYDGDKHP